MFCDYLRLKQVSMQEESREPLIILAFKWVFLKYIEFHHLFKLGKRPKSSLPGDTNSVEVSSAVSSK